MSDEYSPQHAADEDPLIGDAPPRANVLFSNNAYDKVKFCAMIVFPAAGTLYFALASIWGLPWGEEVVGSIIAVDAALGAILGIANRSYEASDAKYDGEIVVEEHPDGTRTGVLQLKNYANPADVVKQDEARFKVRKLG